MSEIHSYPKIFPVGSDFVPDLFKGEVEITEKVDGSQFNFGVSKAGKIVFRSKGKEMYFESFEKMFQKAVDYIVDAQETLLKLPPETYFYGEFLSKPKHNVLAYERTPDKGIVIFGVMLGEAYVRDHAVIAEWAARVGLEAVPLLYKGQIGSFAELEKFMESDSYLGSQKLEGIVVKNYAQPVIIGNRVMPSFAKLVREDFKERHGREWKSTFGKSARIDLFMESFRTEARWQKAVQHLREQGKITNEPKDIGILLREIETDVFLEESDAIKKELLEIFRDQIARKAKAGFPEWYKEQIAKRAFSVS